MTAPLLLAACAQQPVDQAASEPTVPLPTTPTSTTTTAEIPIEPGYCEARYYSGIAVSLDDLIAEILYDAAGRELRAYESHHGERRSEHRWYYDDQGRLDRQTTDIDLNGETDWEYHYTWNADQLVEHATYDPIAGVDHCAVVYEHDDDDALPERSLDGCMNATVAFTYLAGSPDPLETAQTDWGQDGTIDQIRSCDWDPVAQTHTCVEQEWMYANGNGTYSQTYDGDLLIQVRNDEESDGILDSIEDRFYDAEGRLERTQRWTSFTDETTTVTVVWTCF